jgi:hypothetical protein
MRPQIRVDKANMPELHRGEGGGEVKKYYKCTFLYDVSDNPNAYISKVLLKRQLFQTGGTPSVPKYKHSSISVTHV